MKFVACAGLEQGHKQSIGWEVRVTDIGPVVDDALPAQQRCVRLAQDRVDHRQRMTQKAIVIALNHYIFAPRLGHRELQTVGHRQK